MASPYRPSAPFSPSAPGSAVRTTSSISDLGQSHIDAIIRGKRKAREPKACYPCHTRKVKCDRNLPCDGCVKRDHADLCSYERPLKKRQISASQPLGDNFGSGSTVPKREAPPVPVSVPDVASPASVNPRLDAAGARVSFSREDWESLCNKLREMEQTISGLRMGFEQAEDDRIPVLVPQGTRNFDGPNRSEHASPERQGIHTANMFGEGTVHLGPRSVLAYILNKSGSQQAQALLEGGILPKLGLDNETATYPFVDLWSSDTSMFDVSAVCGALPGDQQCKEFFYYYRDIAGTLYPVLVDVPLFEKNLETLLQNRAATGGRYNPSDNESWSQRPFGVTLGYIGLLFAVLASGCQSSDLPGKERELTSQVYVCCSYQCLRMTNFVSQPTIEAMKALLIISNVLSYNMNPGVSYVLIGMTLRMGLALGLHVESNLFPPAEHHARRHVWWSMAWQDSHFSLSYDRPSTTAVSQPDIAYGTGSKPGERSYFETMCRIISLTLEVVRGRMLSPQYPMSFKNIQGYKERIQQILTEAAPHLRDRKYCLSSMDHLERLALQLHTSYIMSELCRPALKATVDNPDPLTLKVRKDCVANLIATVESYIELHSFSSHGSRSWITLQRAISCAFLLAVLDESKVDPQVWKLLRKLEGVIAERAAAEADFETTEAMTTTVPTASSSRGVPAAINSKAIPSTAHTSLAAPDSLVEPASAGVPASNPVDTRHQWTKPLFKSLHALQKLNAAFSKYGVPTGGSCDSPNSSRHEGLHPHPTTPAMGRSLSYSGAMTVATAGTSSSAPPPTPDSSTSSEWTIPNLLDRAAEYIHPPLWG